MHRAHPYAIDFKHHFNVLNVEETNAVQTYCCNNVTWIDGIYYCSLHQPSSRKTFQEPQVHPVET